MDSQLNISINKEIKLNQYKRLRKIFDQKDESGFESVNEFGIDYIETELGLFIPAKTFLVYKLFEDLIKSGFFDPRAPFLDAGSGDARVNQIASLNGVKISIGIECSPEIFEKSKKQTEKFEESKIIEKGSVKLIQGDFTNIDTYKKNGINVADIKTFFNFVNGWSQMLSFIDINSLSGTKIILIDEQFNTSDRILNEFSKYKSIRLKEVIKYVYYKDKDTAHLLTPELLKSLKENDRHIEKQHIQLDVSASGKFSFVESDHSVVTVYLAEKNI